MVADRAVEARPDRLPRGPHKLSRAEVEQSQRERLIAAAADAVAAKGYIGTSVDDIVSRSGVSRSTFYQLFEDKLDCFLAAHRMASELVTAVIADELAGMAAGAPTTALEKLDGLLEAYLQALADSPALARVFLVEVYAAGAPAIRQRRDALDKFVDLLAATFGEADGLLGTSPDQRFAAEVLVAAVSSMVTTLVGVGEADRLPGLRQPLMRLAAQITASTGDPDQGGV